MPKGHEHERTGSANVLSHPHPRAGRRAGPEVMRMGELALALPSPAAVLRRTGPAPHLGNTVELALVAWVQVNQPQG